MLGISNPEEITKDQADFYKVPQGIYVNALVTGGPAAKAGMQARDIITEMGGVRIATLADLHIALSKHKIGDVVSVKVYRYGDKQNYTLSITLGSSVQINNLS
jgi:serine protease Do